MSGSNFNWHEGNRGDEVVLGRYGINDLKKKKDRCWQIL